jgi:hypothetical protein
MLGVGLDSHQPTVGPHARSQRRLHPSRTHVESPHADDTQPFGLATDSDGPAAQAATRGANMMTATPTRQMVAPR